MSATTSASTPTTHHHDHHDHAHDHHDHGHDVRMAPHTTSFTGSTSCACRGSGSRCPYGCIRADGGAALSNVTICNVATAPGWTMSKTAEMAV